MKKKNYLYLLTFAMAAMLSICFVSCSDDDNGGGGDSSLVGTWHSVHSNYTSGYKFYSNGTCIYGEWGKGRSEEWDDEKGLWSASNGTLTITWTDEEDPYIERFSYSFEDDEMTLVLKDIDYGRTERYTRQ